MRSEEEPVEQPLTAPYRAIPKRKLLALRTTVVRGLRVGLYGQTCIETSFYTLYGRSLQILMCLPKKHPDGSAYCIQRSEEAERVDRKVGLTGLARKTERARTYRIACPSVQNRTAKHLAQVARCFLYRACVLLKRTYHGERTLR